ncbi:LLM class flavin-dependent oxidoreductase [Mycolicibacterium sp. BiH015]|uniref:LLM class flavin-dependent oxidoreductase n=1 Tax=Mycolicibacterium sp. BiH015 TaxID=3018808 RepID=UPI0022E6F1C1|nr:LLM class flavin-dependent oxidoreductase [Mycolicibacterium sp. BiH015]MDA2891581.1 LLM class flavin-dependent oxidoreductase [Mycolicibacterium sp. BiH015]
MTGPPRLAVALEGYGWHPQAWRHTTDTRPVADGEYWAAAAATAERALLDFVTFDDSLGPQRRRRPEIEPRWLAGRPDAVLLAAHIAPATRHLGLIPVGVATYTDPSRLAKAFAGLDDISRGRAGWQVRVSSSRHEAELFGREPGVDPFRSAADTVGTVREICGERLVVAALAHNQSVYEFASRSADLVFVTPKGDESLATILDEVAAAGGRALQVYADLYVTFADVVDERSDAEVFSGTPAELAAKICRWQQLGVDGVRLRPAVHSTDLPVIADEVVPLLQRNAGFRAAYRDGETLRRRLGLERTP